MSIVADGPIETQAASAARTEPSLVAAALAPLSRRHIPALDGLRGVAILGVLLFKATEGYTAHTALGAAIRQLFGTGWAGVDLFFVLSGFLITGILLDTRDSPHYFRNFYARRTLRIFPLYYGALFVTFAVAVHFLPTDSPGVERIIRNQAWLWTYTTNIAFLVKKVVFFDASWIHLSHFWSLAIEEQFYLVWPLLVLMLGARRGRLAAGCAVLIVGALSLRLLMYFAHLPRGAMFYPTPCRLDSLASGALLAVLVRATRHAPARWTPLFMCTAAVSGAILIGVWIWRRQLDVNDITTLTFGFTVLAAFAGSILMLSLDPSPRNVWRRALEVAPLRTLGKYSYAMYVMHPMVIAALDTRWPIARVVGWFGWEPLGMLAHSAIFVLATLAPAFVSWHVYEKQFLRAKRYFDDRRSSEK